MYRMYGMPRAQGTEIAPGNSSISSIHGGHAQERRMTTKGQHANDKSARGRASYGWSPRCDPSARGGPPTKCRSGAPAATPHRDVRREAEASGNRVFRCR